MNKLYVMWKPIGGIKIVDVGNDFFMVKFDVREDREKVIDEGPWMIFDHYLVVPASTPDFNPKKGQY